MCPCELRERESDREVREVKALCLISGEMGESVELDMDSSLSFFLSCVQLFSAHPLSYP